jgi:acetyl esterase/lipase
MRNSLPDPASTASAGRTIRDRIDGHRDHSFRFTVCFLAAVAFEGSGLSTFDSAMALDDAKVAPTRTVEFAKRGDRALELDIAVPEGGGDLRPLIVCIHGGGWIHGARHGYRDFIVELAKKGYVAATVSYRLSPVAPWPAQIDDVRAALRYLRSHAKEYGIDPERVGAIGHSAGGHLSLMLGLMPTGAELAEDRIQAVVNYFGPTDLGVAEFIPDVEKMLESLVGGPRSEKGELLGHASPLKWVDRGDAPVLTLHGSTDEIVPVRQARILHEKLEAASIPATLRVLEGRGHGWDGDDARKTMTETLDFFHAYLVGSEQPLIFAEDFEAGTARWKPTDASAWTVVEREGRSVYSLTKKRSAYEPPVRSPHNISLLDGVTVKDFTLDIDLRSTNEPYGHQDLCVFFGHVDSSHFYYAHLGREADPHANSIFLVDGKPRVSIAKERSKGTDWSRGWHRVRVRRDTESGRIEVFFDDMVRPVMVAEDKTFLEGGIGVGSFDDTGDFDSVRLRGVRAP